MKMLLIGILFLASLGLARADFDSRMSAREMADRDALLYYRQHPGRVIDVIEGMQIGKEFDLKFRNLIGMDATAYEVTFGSDLDSLYNAR